MISNRTLSLISFRSFNSSTSTSTLSLLSSRHSRLNLSTSISSSSTLRPTSPRRSVGSSSIFLPISFSKVSMTTSSSNRIPTIQLNPTERVLCQLLQDTCHWLELGCPDEKGGEPTKESLVCQARLAGGWVRDKLLSSESDDIDISLSTMTGHSFALSLQSYLSSSYFTSSDLASDPMFQSSSTASNSTSEIQESSTEVKGETKVGNTMSKIGKIEANPEQSKSLETATATLFGLSLDFVNLRKEIYQDGSRIPVMSFGTPSEDAERRDLTINALLYNVHTRKVEDWTGKGLSDLETRHIRTPLSPMTTFLEDPLRVLRCVRFASRLGWELDKEIVDVLTVKGEGKEKIQEALANKVSRERFGIEVEKMLVGPNPLLSLHLLSKLQLFSLVFGSTPSLGKLMKPSKFINESGQLIETHQPSSPKNEIVAFSFARILDACWKSISQPDQMDLDQHSSNSNLSTLPTSPIPISLLEKIPQALLIPLKEADIRRKLFLAASLVPVKDLEIIEKKGNGFEKWKKVSEEIVLNGLKLANRASKDPVSALHQSIDLFSSPTLDQFDHAPQKESLRDGIWGDGVVRKAAVGMLLRQPLLRPGITSEFLPIGILFSLIHDLVNLWIPTEDQDRSQTSNVEIPEMDQGKAEEVVRIYNQFWNYVQENRLVERAEEKGRLDGHQITKTLGFHPGPLTTRILEAIVVWQFSRPTIPSSETDLATEIEDCKTWLKETWESGGIVPVGERGGEKKGQKGGKKEKQKVEPPKNKKRRSQER